MANSFFVETVKSEGLAHMSYIVGNAGQAAVIDPRRDTDVYIELAQRQEAKITHIFETHRNEDYISGSPDLRRRTGASILHGRGLDWGFGQTVAEGDQLEFGKARLAVLQTPGHTDESISLALSDTSFSPSPIAVFTGDLLFVGSVGRTDFYPSRPEEVAALQYDSIFGKILPLGDHVMLLPAHGAGSVCGSGMASRDFSTLGYERQFSPALQVGGRDEFISRKLAEQHYFPPYFRMMEQLNQAGSAPPLHEMPSPQPLDPPQFEQAVDAGAIPLDVRPAEAFAGAFVPGSLHVPAEMISAYAGYVLDYDRDIVLVADGAEDVSAAVRQLVRMGYDRLAGYLGGGVRKWNTSGRRFDSLQVVSALELKERLPGLADRATILDVRKQDEYRSGHLPGSVHIFVGDLPGQIERLPRDRKTITYCGSGRRASIAASILKRSGFESVVNNLGSMSACRAVGCPVVT